MVLRIYYTDRYQRQDLGISRASKGLYNRLAKQFGVHIETIKKIVLMRENQYGRPRRKRYPGIELKSIKRNVKNRKANRHGTPADADPTPGEE